MKKLLLVILALTSGINFVNAQWQQMSGTPFAGRITCIAGNGKNMFAGTNSSGVYMSTDTGSNWTAANNGMTASTTSALAISGNNIFLGTNAGVFLSTNNGSSWTAMNSGLSLTNLIVWSLAVSGSNIFAGTEGGVCLSTDNGNSWTAVNNGLPSNPFIWALAVNGNNIFAGSDYVGRGGIFLSTNNGGSWTAVNSGLTIPIIGALAVSGSNIFAGTAAGGVFLSANNGSSWTAVNNGLTISIVNTLAVSGGNIFAGTEFNDVFLSTNNGSSWTPVNSGLSNPDVNALTVNSGYVFAGTWGSGIWRRPLSELTAVENINVDNNGISIYPNPLTSSSILQLNAEIKNAVVIIYDMLGKEMTRKRFTGKSIEIEKGTLESGVYFVSVSDNERQYIQKIVVN